MRTATRLTCLFFLGANDFFGMQATRTLAVTTAPLKSFARLYGGEIFVLRQLPSMVALVTHAQQTLYSTLGLDPVSAETESPAEVKHFVDRCGVACDGFNADAEAASLWDAVVREVCGPLSAHIYCDKYKLRCSPTASATRAWDSTRLVSANPTQSVLPPHRDTWGSCIDAQINWWAPIFSVESNRTLEIFPALFDTPIPNTSGQWSVKEFAAWKKFVANGADVDEGVGVIDGEIPAPPMLPTVAPTSNDSDCPDHVEFLNGVAVVVDPGDLVLFSAAHLHRSVPNKSAVHRFSTEIRTVFLPDVRAGHGAPNVDCALERAPRLNWFHSLNDPSTMASTALGKSRDH